MFITSLRERLRESDNEDFGGGKEGGGELPSSNLNFFLLISLTHTHTHTRTRVISAPQ